MHHLHIKAWPSSSSDALTNRFDVTWGYKRESDNLFHLDLQLTSGRYSSIALAELFVAHHCLCERALFNHDFSGPNLNLTFGSSQTLAFFDEGLNPFDMMLIFRTRFKGASVSKGDRFSYFPGSFDTESSLVFDSAPVDAIQTKKLGPVKITQHAYDRYWERCIPDNDKPTIKSPYRSLVNTIQSQSLEPVSINDDYPLKKKLQQGIDNFHMMNVYRDTRNDVHFLLSPQEKGISSLVTFFMRNEKHYVYYSKSKTAV